VIFLIRWFLRRRRERRAAGAEAETPRATAAARGNLWLVLHQTRYDLLGILRNRQARFFTLILPILFLVIFVAVFGNNITPDGIKLSTYYVPGIAALGVIASSFINLVISITVLREEGILKRRRATPVPAWALIAARTLTAVVVSLVVVAVLLAIGRLGYHVSIPTSTLPGIAVTTVVGSITFCILGYALSTAIHSEDAAQPMVQAIMLPLYFISGIFVPNIHLPSWLKHVAQVFPVEHLADGLHRAYAPNVSGVGIVWADLGAMAIWAAIGLVVALRRFSWLPSAAS
jgi:ABC-2 type transport system permease protein